MGPKISINYYNSEGLLLLKQFTEEKLGKAERTDLDPHFEDLGRKTDKVKTYTEKLVKDTEAVLVPNPGTQFKFDLMYQKKIYNVILKQYYIVSINLQ